MAPTSEPRLLALHGLRLRHVGSPDDIATITGLDAHVISEILEKAADDGLAVHRDGERLAGWSLTADGRAEQERLVADELLVAGAEAVVAGAYRRFLALNGPFLQLCTDWQMRDGSAINDHGDADYDREVVERLAALHAAVEPVLAELEGALDRYGGYRGRFEHALDRLASGDGEWFDKPMIDSYHTAWFQLHEDLLTTLGLERDTEDVT